MDKSTTQLSEDYKLGKQLIKSAIIMDQALAELLKIETKKMKKLLNTPDCAEELEKSNMFLKSIIFLLTMTEEKIKNGISLCNNAKKK
ncbi:MAG TPA: hypothetical protein GXZ32_03975 [Clostridiales bacterium]|nr:hypothetical protein [Clostridiales bacterium]